MSGTSPKSNSRDTTFSSTRIQTREIFSVQGSCGESGAGSGAMAGALLTGSGAGVGISAAAVGTGKAGPAPYSWAEEAAFAGCAAGGETLRASMGSQNALCAAHFAATRIHA